MLGGILRRSRGILRLGRRTASLRITGGLWAEPDTDSDSGPGSGSETTGAGPQPASNVPLRKGCSELRAAGAAADADDLGQLGGVGEDAAHEGGGTRHAGAVAGCLVGGHGLVVGASRLFPVLLSGLGALERRAAGGAKSCASQRARVVSWFAIAAMLTVR